MESAFSETHAHWPSLRIDCPNPPAYHAVGDSRHHDLQSTYGSTSLESPRGPRERALSFPSAQKPSMNYYPVSPIAEEPLGYSSMGSSFPYSPTMRSTSGPVGYRSTTYGMPGSRGPLPMMSPVRSPAVNRRFMEPVDGYIYQVLMIVVF
jgi:hypothetical protein